MASWGTSTLVMLEWALGFLAPIERMALGPALDDDHPEWKSNVAT